MPTKPKKKPLGKPVNIPESESDEAATPTQRDISSVDALIANNPLLQALWNATPHKHEDEDTNEG